MLKNKNKETLCAIIRKDPTIAGWIRAWGEIGEYQGRGRILRIPYKSLVALLGFDDYMALHDINYAFVENLKAITRVENACPYKGAIVVTDVPDETGMRKFVVTLTEE